MFIRVFHKFSENLTSPKLKIEKPVVESIKDQLDGLKEAIKWEKDALKKRKLLRQIARLERFNDLQEWKILPEEKDKIQAILKGKSSENYLGSDLLSLKKHWVDIAHLILVSEKNPEENINSSTIAVGNSFVVNFGVNKYLNANIGAGDILGAEISKITVNGTEGVRRNTPRPGYYAGNKYLPIFDGDKIEIVSKWTLNNEEWKLAQDATGKRWERLRINDMIEENNERPLTNLSEDIILQNKITEFKNDITTKIKSFSRYQDIRKISEFALPKNDFNGIADNIWIQRDDIPKILSIMSAIGIQESGSNYGALGLAIDNPKSSHYQDRAIWRYQIMPNNWWAWSRKYFGEILDPKNSQDQDKLAFAQIWNYYLGYVKQWLSFNNTIGEISQDWYWRGRTNQWPTTEKYKESVLAIYNSLESKLQA